MTAPVVPTNSPRPSRIGAVLGGLALVVASAALALSVWTWLDAREPSYTEGQQGAARATACSAYAKVSTGVATNTNLTPPGGDEDVTGSLAVAANARIALSGGGQYLLARLDPATPPEVADPMRDFADKLMDFGAAATAGALNTDPAQANLLTEIDALNTDLEGLCR